jgi:hypothetical protein
MIPGELFTVSDIQAAIGSFEYYLLVLTFVS